MADRFPTSARVVIIGGGVAGCSTAYHLAKLGWSDVVLLERGTLTCGTSWHAAGLVMQLRTTHTMTEICRYGAKLYANLEAETGQATGFKQVGSLPVARNADRFIEIKRLASLGRYFGIDAEILSPNEVTKYHPLVDPGRVVGALFIPGDGQTDPVGTVMALAKGARTGGVTIIERTPVVRIETKDGAVSGVVTEKGRISCEAVMLCGGIWTRDIAATAGVAVPNYASEHMYVTTKPIAGVRSGLPVIRDTDGTVYIKEDAGKFVVGSFEPESKPLPMESLPADFEFGELPENWDLFAPRMSNAIEMVPALANAEIRHFMNGPESFTPDNRFILGEAPELRKFYVACGFNSQGILAGAGVGRAMAEWVVADEPQMDLSEIDIARFHPFQTNRRYLHDRIRESLGLLHAMHWPYRQVVSARPVRETPLHARLAARGACFGEAAGWERANWYAPAGVTPAYEYSYGRQNWFPFVGEEHKAVRERVGLFDLSSFAKYFVEGPDAERELERISANSVAVPVGKIVYTTLLNDHGGIEADLTVTRLAADRYMIVTAAAAQRRDFTWIRRNVATDARVVLTDVTSAYAVLSVMGPRSRALLERLSSGDFSNEAFPFGTCREIEIAYAKALAFRVTYVGELGWELYLPTEFAGPVFDALTREGAELGLKLAGYHALDSLRSEKGYRHWGHDVSPGDTVLEAGLGFTASFTKDFIGRAAVEKQKKEGLKRRLVHVLLDEPEPLIFHGEPILRDGVIVGRVTSGSYGYTLGRAVGMGYLEKSDGITPAFIDGGRYEVEIAAERFGARVSTKPFYDPKGERIRM
ncbi:MAG: FAD-dependent oxidoreductase [Alphaproteobacteria bacterium]